MRIEAELEVGVTCVGELEGKVMEYFVWTWFQVWTWSQHPQITSRISVECFGAVTSTLASGGSSRSVVSILATEEGSGPVASDLATGETSWMHTTLSACSCDSGLQAVFSALSFFILFLLFTFNHENQPLYQVL